MSVLRDKPAKGAKDIAKILIILGLPFVHLIAYLFSYEYAGESLYSIAVGVGALVTFGGPVFITCYGVELSENRSPKGLIKMGIQMLIIAILLNIFRYTIVDLCWPISGLTTPVYILTSIFSSDLFVFTGMFSIAYGLSQKAKMPLWLITVIAAALYVVNILFQTADAEALSVVNIFLGLFINGYNDAFFSLFGWGIVGVIGLWIGRLLKQEEKKRNRIFGIMLIGSVVVFVAYSIFISNFDTTVFEVIASFIYYFLFGWEQFIPMMSVGIFVLSAIYFIYKLVPDNKVERALITMSKLTMPFYLIHWVLIDWLVILPLNILYFTVGNTVIEQPLYWISAIGITVLTALFCYFRGFSFSRWLLRITDYTRWFKKNKKTKKVQAQ